MAKRGLNMRWLATEISKREGGKVNLPIAQISEVLKHAFIIIGTQEYATILDTVDKYKYRK